MHTHGGAQPHSGSRVEVPDDPLGDGDLLLPLMAATRLPNRRSISASSSSQARSIRAPSSSSSTGGAVGSSTSEDPASDGSDWLGSETFQGDCLSPGSTRSESAVVLTEGAPGTGGGGAGPVRRPRVDSRAPAPTGGRPGGTTARPRPKPRRRRWVWPRPVATTGRPRRP